MHNNVYRRSNLAGFENWLRTESGSEAASLSQNKWPPT